MLTSLGSGAEIGGGQKKLITTCAEMIEEYKTFETWKAPLLNVLEAKKSTFSKTTQTSRSPHAFLRAPCLVGGQETRCHSRGHGDTSART